MPLSVVTPATQEPLTVIEAKAHLHIEGNDSDAYIGTLISSARSHVEKHLLRTLTTTTLKLSLDFFKIIIELKRGPVQEVTNIKYIDTNGVVQTLPVSEYQVDLESEMPRICPAYSKSWPSTQPGLNAVNIEYKSGYGDDGESIPESIKHAMLLLIGHWFVNRETVLVGTSQTSMDFTTTALLAPFKLPNI
ncbi:MAG: head-tail connector protein [Methylococcales bacterium]